MLSHYYTQTVERDDHHKCAAIRERRGGKGCDDLRFDAILYSEI